MPPVVWICMRGAAVAPDAHLHVDESTQLALFGRDLIGFRVAIKHSCGGMKTFRRRSLSLWKVKL